MNFVYPALLPAALILFVVFAFLYRRYEVNYFKWVKKYWFYRATPFTLLRRVFFLLAILLLSLAALDLRGPEETITGEIPDQKTIILIDTSSSMLAEDIRPNRLQKSLVLARHFVKQVVGHQIALAVFSDTTLQITPFTDDPNFLDAKLQALEGLSLRRGGTSLVQALNEAIQIFRVQAGQGKVAGNLLVFTDSEDNGDMTKLLVPETVNVAFVGVGTRDGAKIPVKGRNGEFLYYKKHQGQEIVTKLDEDKIKDLGNKIAHFKYWVALSYSLPTDEIEDFLRQRFQASLSTGQMKVRPVLAQWLIIPAIICLMISFAFELAPALTFILILGLVLLKPVNSFAQQMEQSPQVQKDKKVELSPLYRQLEPLLKSGKADRGQKLKMAEELARAGQFDKALQLYDENLNESSDAQTLFNYATTLLQTSRSAEGIRLFSQLKDQLVAEGGQSEIIEQIRRNLARFFNQSKKDNQQKKDDKQEEKKEDKKKDEQNKKDEDKKKDEQNKKDEDKKKDEQNKKDEDKKKDEQNKKDEEKKKDDQNKKDEDKKKDEEKKKQEQKKSAGTPRQQLEKKEKELRQKRKMQQIPGIINQIMDEDQAIMRKNLDASAAEPQAQQKDW